MGKAHRYVFGPFRFDAATGELLGPDRSTKLRCQAALALELLLSRQGEVVSRHELRKLLWPDDRVVSFEASIAAVVRELRRALGDDSSAPHFIETVPKRGYRFLVPCTQAEFVELAAHGTAAGVTLRTNHRRGGFLRISEAMVLTLLILPMGDTGHFQREGARQPSPVTVAVHPFENLSGRPAHEVLAESLPRDLVGWLGDVVPARLRVVDRTGAENVGAASRGEHRVDFTILGSVRDDGGATVISARMLSGADGSFAWGERYRRNVEDGGLTAREVAARIADSVVSKSVPQWRNGSTAATANAAAADAFRRGTDAMAQLSPEGMMQAEAAFSEAIELDPGFSAAYARLAETLIHWMGATTTRERVERARQAAATSIELVETHAAGHRLLGEIGLYYDRDWEQARRHLERSIELAPSDASGHHSYATWLSARGRHDEALREVDLAAALDPGSVSISIDVMFLRYYARDFEGAVIAARRLERLWPGYVAPHRTVVLSQLAMGEVAAAAAEARTVLARHPEVMAGHSLAGLSDSEALEAYWTVLLDVLTRYVIDESGDPTVLAGINIQLGRLDAAQKALESALDAGHFSYFLPYLGVSPSFDRMCGDPGFERILRRLQQSALGNATRPPRCAAAMAAAGNMGS